MEKFFVGQYGIDLPMTKIIKDIDILPNRAYQSNSNIDFLLEQIDIIKNKNLKIVFVLPNISDVDYKMLIKKYTYITFYKYIEYKKMLDLVSRAKVYVSATKSDGTSLFLLEAFALECISVVSNIISNRSWVLDGINGYTFNNKKDFLLKLSQALDAQDSLLIVIINKNLLAQRGTYAKQMKKIEECLF